MLHYTVPTEHLPKMLEELARPWHTDVVRRPGEIGRSEGTVDLSAGFRLCPGPLADGDVFALTPAFTDLRRFMARSMAVDECETGYAIRLVCEQDTRTPGNDEGFRVSVSRDSCTITAGSSDGIRRGLFYLEDEMALRRRPVLRTGNIERHAAIAPRIVRSPLAPYRWLSGWELEDETDYYPDEYLNSLAHCGANGIWVAGLLRNLVASDVIPELGPPEHRLGKLRDLAARARRYGIKTYLFCIEPRILPAGHVLRRTHPELCSDKGHLCTSTEKVREYIREAVRSLVETVPELGGIINIFNGERLTSCWSNAYMVQCCPRCRVRRQEAVLAESLDCYVDGFRRGNSRAKLLAWSYAMMDPRNRHTSRYHPNGSLPDVMRLSDPEIVWLCNFEHGGEKCIAGKQIGIFEYALSYTGPSATFERFTEQAREMGRTVYAKLQTGTTYELASQPWLPLPVPAVDKVLAARRLGVEGAMLTWVPGGWPSPILKATCEACFSESKEAATILTRVAGVTFGPEAVGPVCAAWRSFADAFDRLPFSLELQRESPLTRSPQYHLTLESETRPTPPYNWGITRQRTPQPFRNDVQNWLGDFTCEELVGCLRDLCDKWEAAFKRFASVAFPGATPTAFSHECAISRAALIQFRSCANVYEFCDLRERLAAAEDRSVCVWMMRRMLALAEAERRLAGDMLPLLDRHPAIGYHPETYDFPVSRQGLRQKIRQLEQMMPMLQAWIRKGRPDRARLAMTVEQSLGEVPDRWGD